MNKYRVYITIPGSPSRPFYDGYVDVVADTDDDAADRAKRQLTRTTFRDVWYSSMRVTRVERNF